jgi:hypothetical protein
MEGLFGPFFTVQAHCTTLLAMISRMILLRIADDLNTSNGIRRDQDEFLLPPYAQQRKPDLPSNKSAQR